MAVKKKISPSADKFIGKGAPVKGNRERAFKNVLIRIPTVILLEVDSSLEKKPWITRTQWIIDAINEKIKAEM